MNTTPLKLAFMLFFCIILSFSNCNAEFKRILAIADPPDDLSFHSIIADSKGNFYTASFFSIRKYDKNGNFIKKISFLPYEDYLIFVSGLGIDANDNLYVANSLGTIAKYSSDLILMFKFGSSGPSIGQFSAVDVAVDSHGNIFVADDYSPRIQKFDSHGNFISTIGSYGGNDNEFTSLKTITIDNDNNIFVLDGQSTWSKIKKFSNNGAFISSWNKSLSHSPSEPSLVPLLSNGVAAAPNGYIIAIGGNILHKFSANGDPIDLEILNGLTGAPTDVYVDKNGLIYVADLNGAFVYQWDLISSPTKPINSIVPMVNLLLSKESH